MILINRTLPDVQIKPIVHKGGNPERFGEVMTLGELHDFGLGLLIAYLYRQKGQLICANGKLGNEYPHLVAKNPKGELLYIWVKTEMCPTIPSIGTIENQEEVCKLANQFKAIPVFAGIRLTCTSTKEENIPIYGGGYTAEFTGLKAF